VHIYHEQVAADDEPTADVQKSQTEKAGQDVAPGEDDVET
jgi:hypothetical protein